MAASAALLDACAASWPGLNQNCDYQRVAEKAIHDRYPGFASDRELAIAQYEDVMIAFYPVSNETPGGTAHAILDVRDCGLRDVYLTQ